MRDELIRTEKHLDETYWWFVGRRALAEYRSPPVFQDTGVAIDIGVRERPEHATARASRRCGNGPRPSRAALELAAAHGFPTAHADGQAIPLTDCSVGLLSALDVLEHLDDMLALEEFHRILRPDGLLLVTVPACRFLWSEHDEALKHRRRYVASELHMKLTGSGFGVLKRSYVVFFTFFPIVLYRLFRGLFPKDPFAPKASHVILPDFLNNFLIRLLKFEAWLTRAINLPWGTSIVVLAQKEATVSAHRGADQATLGGLRPRETRPARLDVM